MHTQCEPAVPSGGGTPLSVRRGCGPRTCKHLGRRGWDGGGHDRLGCSPSQQLVSADALSVLRGLALLGLRVSSGTCCACQTRPGDSLSSRFHLHLRKSCTDVGATFSCCSAVLRRVCFSLDTRMNLWGQCCPRRICYRRRSNNNSKNAGDNRTAEERGDAGTPWPRWASSKDANTRGILRLSGGRAGTYTGRCAGGRKEAWTGLPQARACACTAGPACFWKSQGRVRRRLGGEASPRGP